MCLIQCLSLNGHVYLSDIWLGVNLRTDQKNDMCRKEIGPHFSIVLIILDAIVNRLGKPTWSFNNYEILHFDNYICSYELKIMGLVATCMIWICYSSQTDFVFRVLQEVGAGLKVSV